MKRIIALVLFFICLSGSALGEVYVTSFKGTPVFSITYDSNVFELNDTDVKSYNTDTYEWCFMLYSDRYSIFCDMENVKGFEGFSLFSASAEKTQAYAELLCEINSEYACEFEEVYRVTVTNGTKKAEIPFIILHMNDKELGETYYAETIANGCAIYFEIFDEDAKHPNSEKKQILLSLLDTFTPIP